MIRNLRKIEKAILLVSISFMISCANQSDKSELRNLDRVNIQAPITPEKCSDEQENTNVSSDYVSKPEESSDCSKFPFKFVVVKNIKMTSKSRHIKIFIEPNAFSEDNLIYFFKRFSNDFVSQERLYISVITDWKQLSYRYPLYCPRGGISGSKAPKIKIDNFNYAKFSRGFSGEYILIYPKGDSKKMKRIILRNKTQS